MIFGRSPIGADSGPAPVAVYARVLDGAHLWLAVRDAGTLRLGSTEVPTEPDPVDGDLVTAVVALAPAFGADVDEVALTSGPAGRAGGRGDRPVRLAYLRPDGPTVDVGFEVAGRDDGLVVRRTRAPSGTPVTGFASDGDAAMIRLAHPGPVEVVQDGEVLATLPVRDGVVTITDVALLGPGRPGVLRVDGGPLVRARNVLARPQAAVLLPPLTGGLELRWQPNGRLVLVRREPTDPPVTAEGTPA